MATDSVTFLGCGDVGPIHEPMDTYSKLVRPVLAAGDIRFGQCERLYSERGALQLHAGASARHGRLKPHMASVYSNCGFDVVSLASNHAMDWGEDAMMDSIKVLRDRGMQVIGAGRDLEDARQPAIIEKNGVKVAVLAYCSVLAEGFAAGQGKAGANPLRAHTYYEAPEYQPGVPPRVVTIPYEEDMLAMEQDIVAAKKNADAVVISMHWGIHFVPRVIADYQSVAAKAAFKAGADLIIGHHAHVPKAIAVYGGKVCFYSMSNFIMSSAASHKPGQLTANAKRLGAEHDPDYPLLPYGKDGKRSLIAKAVLSKKGVDKVSFLPVLINKALQPEVLRHGDPRFDDAVNFMDWASEGFDHKFTVDGDEVVISSWSVSGAQN